MHPSSLNYRLSLLLALSALSVFAVTVVRADPPADTPEVKVVRDQLLDWDKKQATNTLEEERKSYHADNDKEAQYMDYLAHESWEEAKAQKAVRDKWGADAEAKFAHLLTGSTLEDDQTCAIKVDGDHATVTWDNIKGMSPLPLIKVDGRWLVDGHAIYQEATKDDPEKAPAQFPTGKLMKDLVKDIGDGKYDDIDSLIADVKTKLGIQDGN